MSKIHNSITELIGKTPLLRLNRIEKEFGLDAEIVAKLEYLNPNQSIKERIALAMIEAGEKSGELKEGDTIVEISSGNTGVGLAAIAAAKGYKFRAYIQDTASPENFKILKAFGTETHKLLQQPVLQKALQENGGNLMGALQALLDEVSKEERVFTPNQMTNPNNPAAHRATTGPEIWADTDGRIDVFVAGAGTAGTLTGAGGYLKEKNPKLKVVAFQPDENSRIESGIPGVPEILGVHPIKGVPNVPPLLDTSVFEEVVDVYGSDAYAAARAAARLEGLLVGTSSGAALHTAILLAKRSENKGKRIVAIFPDSGTHYLSTPLFDLES
jgi:cysteine synthase A